MGRRHQLVLALLTPVWTWSALAGPPEEPAPPDTTAAEAWTPHDAVAALYQALSARDQAVDCAALATLSDEPAPALLEIIENAAQPPWAPVRAAHCLVTEHPGFAQEPMRQWVTDPALRGLTLLTLGLLDEVPVEIALDVAQHSLVGPHGPDARTRLPRSRHPELRALVE